VVLKVIVCWVGVMGVLFFVGGAFGFAFFLGLWGAFIGVFFGGGFCDGSVIAAGKA